MIFLRIYCKGRSAPLFLLSDPLLQHWARELKGKAPMQSLQEAHFEIKEWERHWVSDDESHK